MTHFYWKSNCCCQSRTLSQVAKVVFFCVTIQKKLCIGYISDSVMTSFIFLLSCYYLCLQRKGIIPSFKTFICLYKLGWTHNAYQSLLLSQLQFKVVFILEENGMLLKHTDGTTFCYYGFITKINYEQCD